MSDMKNTQYATPKVPQTQSTTIPCPTCSRENRSVAKYCRYCGKTMQDASAAPFVPSVSSVAKNERSTDYIGLEKIRTELNKQKVLLELQKRGNTGGNKKIVFIFQGNTGSGKSLVASCFIKELKSKNLLSSDKILEKSAKELSNTFRSEFEITKYFNENQYGAIVIDEIQQSIEYLNELLRGLKKSTGESLCIILGLKEPLAQYFKEHPEDVSFCNETFDFPDQSDEDLALILEKELANKNMVYDDSVKEIFIPYIQESRYNPDCQNKNGWLVENDIIPNILKQQAERLTQKTELNDDDFKTILKEDLPLKTSQKSINEIFADLDEMTGLAAAKKAVREIADTIEMQKEMAEQSGEPGKKTQAPSVHIVFTGNPGTGKTTVARMLGQLFKSIGLLPSDKVIEVDKSKLVASYVGQTAPLVNQWCDKAMGGILFIDEAYSITGGKDGDTDSFGQDAIDALLKRMEDDRGKFVVIAAGYKNEMKHFLDANPGLQSRFTHFIDLEDYTPDELFAIFTSIVQKNGLAMTQEASNIAREKIEETYRNRTKNFANGREVRNMYDETIRRRSSRLVKMSKDERTKDALSTILPEDIAFEKKKVLTVDEILSELDAMIGLSAVKKAVRELANKIEMQKEREEKGAGEAKRMGIHIVFTGNPGTGKTTVARKLGALFKAMDLLPRSDVIEKDKSGMVGQYVGSTPKLVNQACDDAMGAILFVDEAYTLAGEDGMKDSFGQEAIDTLMKRMEDDRGKFVVIAAGYKKEMERFLTANPGMRSRFTDFIHLDDYNPDELFQIYELTLKNENYFLDEEAKAKAKEAITEIYNNRGDDFANGRTMRNLADETTRRQSSRISELTKDERTTEVLTTITADDIPFEKQKTVSVKEILSELDSMIGLQAVKKAVRELAQTVQMDIEKADEGLGSNMPVVHIVFTGNPGTGKTTVVRKLGKLFQAMKLLPSAKVVEVDRSKLVASYVGQTGPLANQACDEAMGGILFIDEAYSLVSGGGNDFGQEAIDTLLKRMEDDRGKFVVIAAGYEDEMQGFIEANPGLKSRFTHFIHLEDYNPDELAAIYLSMAKQQGYKLTAEAEDGIKAFAASVYDNRGKDFANGRTMRNYLDETIRRQASRISELPKAERSREVLMTITEEDTPK